MQKYKLIGRQSTRAALPRKMNSDPRQLYGFERWRSVNFKRRVLTCGACVAAKSEEKKKKKDTHAPQ
jgi:hypothetical protein